MQPCVMSTFASLQCIAECLSCIIIDTVVITTEFYTPCGLRGCKNGPTPFPGQMSYKATKPGLVSVLYLSMFLLCWCFLGPLFMYC